MKKMKKKKEERFAPRIVLCRRGGVSYLLILTRAVCKRGHQPAFHLPYTGQGCSRLQCRHVGPSCVEFIVKMAAEIPKMKLWYYPMYRPVRCAWLIKELGLDDKVEYKFVPIGPPPPSPEREQYRKSVHPNSTVPALEIEGRTPILDSVAICLYLADLCGQLCPEPKDRAEYYDWILYAGSRMDEVMEVLTMQWMFAPKEKQNQEIIDRAMASAKVCFDRVEATLKDKPYILGQKLTAADCVLGFNMLWAAFPEMNKGILLEGYPNCKAYLERIKARPAMKAAMELPGAPKS